MLFTGKQSRFESLVRAYAAELYRYAYWLARERFTAEDLVQETFARAWNAWDSLRDDRAAKSWLYTILRHEHARLYERKRVDVDDALEIDTLPDPAGASAFEGLELREALKTLPPAYREPLLLQTLGGFSCAEIAQMLNTTEGAVMTRLTRARLALRKLPGWDVRGKAKTR
jgi:RNA polymerase sigma-70 factor, ECF subfamily